MNNPDFQKKNVEVPKIAEVYGGTKLYLTCYDHPLWFALDLPFSAVVDTIILPYTITKEIHREE